MVSPYLFISTMILFAFTQAPNPGPVPQEAAPAPTAAPARNHAKPNSEAQAHAKKLYAIDCAMCHGENGNGKTDLAKDMQLNLADWTDSKSLANKSDEDLFKAVRNGKGKMPAEDANRANDDVVRSIIFYIRNMPNLPKDQPAEAPPVN